MSSQPDSFSPVNAASSHFAIRNLQGFEVRVLANEAVEIAVVPELGARIISLKNLRTDREWMWHPPGGLKLFQNSPGVDFSESPLVGLDECLPTIAPCSWQGRQLPDHGEIWNTSWRVDIDAWKSGLLKTSARLQLSPFEIERTIELRENEIHLDYRLLNRSSRSEKFLWAMHPLLRLQTGDQLELPSSTRALLSHARWIDDLHAAFPPNFCTKLFATPLSEGFAAIGNSKTGDRLEFEWNPSENPTLGLWFTRGGWHGHDQFALEPMNGNADALDSAAEQNACGTIAASSSTTWQITLRLGMQAG